MKRKLLWFAVMFALGEVTYIFANEVIRISIILVMLICCAWTKKIKLVERILLCLFFVLGVLNVYKVEKTEIPETNNYEISGQGNLIDKKESEYGFTYTVEFVDNVVIKGEEYEIGRVLLYGVKENYSIGQVCEIKGTLEVFQAPRNPGAFNMKAYYKSKEITFYIRGAEITKQGYSEENMPVMLFYKYKQKMYGFRTLLSRKIRSYVSAEYVGIYESILLGEKGELDSDIKTLYRINGIAHILAISGLHVTLIGGMIYKLFRRIGFKFLLSGGMSIGIILSYGVMTGNSNSTLRAVIMIVISLIGEILGRNYDMLTGMGAAMFIMLISNPYKIYDGGIILSFLAVLGVVLGRYIFKQLLQIKEIKRLKKKKLFLYNLINSLVVTTSINIVTLPVIISLYYEFPLYSIIINLIVIPLMTPVVLLGLASLFVSFFNIPFAKMLIYPGEKILVLYEGLCDLFVELPFSTINVGIVSKEEIALYYLCCVSILLITSTKIQKLLRDKIYKITKAWPTRIKWIKLVASFVVIVVFAFGCLIAIIHLRNKNEVVCFLDVGQGDGILIRTKGGTNMVIDGGSTSNDDVGEYVIMPAIKYMAMADIDYWFVTHTDEDHISGLEYILSLGKKSGIRVNNLVVSENIFRDEKLETLLSLAKKHGVNIVYFNCGEEITDGEFSITCCFPYEGFEIEDKNQGSMALSYVSSNLKILFTGDMDKEGCEVMLENCAHIMEEEYDVLKVPHHGSKYSISKALYSYIDDGYAVVSCSENNLYGHPHKETLQELKDSNCQILITKNEGAIFVVSPFQTKGFLIY